MNLKKVLDKTEILIDKRGNRGGRSKKNYLDIVTAFDIETSTIWIPEKDDYYSFMYIWQWDFEGITILGRTWEEFIRLTEYLNKVIPENVKLVVWVHNLAYEFAYLSGIYSFTEKQVFAPQSHKVLKCDLRDKLEFRCSYKHSNMSLDRYLKQMGVDNQKKVGQLDYSIIRYPWTELSESEMEYCINDVKGLTQAIRYDMQMSGDDLITIPLTSTGYLRRDVKKAMRKYSFNKLRNTIPPYEVYILLRRAFEGGDTHANRYFANKKLANVQSDDRSSSYPAVQINEQFPMGKWRKCDNNDLLSLYSLSLNNYAWAAEITLTGVEMRDEYFPDPVISKSKCKDCENVLEDNGRVLSAAKIRIAVTDVKWSIIKEVYKWESIVISKCYYSKYGLLPEPYRKVILDNYKSKTELKGVEGQEYYYFKRKEKTNSAYGMSAQDPVQLSYIYDNGDFVLEDKDPEKVYNKYTAKAFLSYAWGVWTTAHARKHLYLGIRCVYDNGGYVYYWDTDSVKHSPGRYFDDYNKNRIDENIESEGYADDPAGKRHYLGVYEYEGQYEEFKTLGAKKYVYRENGELHITIAGVNKNLGADELEENGGLEAFTEGFVFDKAGGTKIKYHNCHFDYDTPEGKITITNNACITPTTYTLGLTASYIRLLDMLNCTKKGKEFCEKLHLEKC